ncbi:MAG: pullulanase [Melioribacteraceae bacterium]|nr:pullulanase [Melioribacteraceae bacterium]
MKRLKFLLVSLIFLLTISSNQSMSEIIENSKVDLDTVYSSKQLGSFIKDGKTVFRLFAPSAVEVLLFTYEEVNDTIYSRFEMKNDEDGVWEVVLEGEIPGLFYGYKVFHENEDTHEDYKPLCVDPYAKAVASYTSYLNPRKSIVCDDKYDWEDDTWIKRDWRDLIIYEMHVRDMTRHSSSGVSEAGTYKGLVEKGKTGGLDYIKNLGVNTVELLPAMEFGVVEIPYKDTVDGKFNTWNPYERNHWGYMTSNFFAPAAYYSENWKELEWNTWMGTDTKQVTDFKDMVKGFHNEGIAVVMDVVYNHLSEYELGNLKQIDKEYYFRLDEHGHFISESYCGNDLKTERPMLRKLIVESILYWMKEYHVDGFRFDLGKLIDWETLEVIIEEARKVNPDVVFVAEPWGGGYDPQGFSKIDWGSWNDQIRNGIKGENPDNGHGWIFGKWYGNNDLNRIKSYVNGTLQRDSHGLFLKKEHSVNYLESHDGYTLGDFIRIGAGHVDHEHEIIDVEKHVKLTKRQLSLNQLAAAFLMTSQGITMLHSGQEYARSKVIPYYVTVDDTNKGKIDHNTYNKDNEVNYLNYDHATINKALLNYYKGLIALRNKYEAFRKAKYVDIGFNQIKDNPFALAYSLNYYSDRFYVLFNADQNKSVQFELPSGTWEVLVDDKKAGTEVLDEKIGYVDLNPISAMVLKMKK